MSERTLTKDFPHPGRHLRKGGNHAAHQLPLPPFFIWDLKNEVKSQKGGGAVADVLHAFEKKSKTGRAMPRRDMELIRQRLREAEQIARDRKQ